MGRRHPGAMEGKPVFRGTIVDKHVLVGVVAIPGAGFRHSLSECDAVGADKLLHSRFSHYRLR